MATAITRTTNMMHSNYINIYNCIIYYLNATHVMPRKPCDGILIDGILT
jgi:hypothetical protein